MKYAPARSLLTIFLVVCFLDAVAQARRGGRGFSGARSSFSRGFSSGGSSKISFKSSFSSGKGTGIFSKFRGSGRSHGSSSPTITNAHITSRLNERHSQYYSNGHAHRHYNNALVKDTASPVFVGVFMPGYLNGNTIARPEVPIRVNNMLYFWGPQYLPQRNDSSSDVTYNSEDEAVQLLEAIADNDSSANSTECIEMETAYADNVTICMSQSAISESRCSKDISFLSDTKILGLVLPDGTKPKSLNWSCPVGQACCEWECCDGSAIEESRFPTWKLWLIVIVTGCLIFGLVLFLRYKGYDYRWGKNRLQKCWNRRTELNIIRVPTSGTEPVVKDTDPYLASQKPLLWAPVKSLSHDL